VRVLALDTATAATTVALADVPAGSEAAGPAALRLELRDDPPPGQRPGHARRLLPLIAELLERGGGWEAVERIAVGTGPGTFTGMRIGLATAYALSRARAIPLVGISTLQSLALGGLTAAGHIGVLALLDARRGELFAAGWGPGGTPGRERPVIEPTVADPDALAATVATVGRSPLAVGDGAVKFRVMLERAGAVVPPDASALHMVSALEHCALAVGVQPGEPGAVRPAYLRLADAELARREQ
jgi:tRNA threonylcarbamoyladenosine biosynthesis protein TsaB